MVENYLNYILYIRGLSNRTFIKYKKALIRFDRYLRNIGKSIEKPQEIELADIFSFIEFMAKSWLQPSSSNAVIEWMKGYFKYLKEILNIDVIDHKKIIRCKVPERNIWFYNSDQKKEILKAVNEWVGVKESTKLRNKLLTYMLMMTWLRCHEVAKIKVSEIWECLQVIGKWWKRRVVFLRKELLDMIGEYLKKRKENSEYLFEGTYWHIKEWSIRNIYIKMARRLGFRIHAHKFRHTFATDLIHTPWANIYNVARLLWHKRITTTQIYLWSEDAELKKLQFRLKFI